MAQTRPSPTLSRGFTRLGRFLAPYAILVSRCARESRTSQLFRIVPEYFGSKFLIARSGT